MILFLDFDGVLHSEVKTSDREIFSKTPHLWEILRQVPEAEVVFSTSWKSQFPLDELIGFATSNGGEDLAHRFLGCTPDVPKGDRDDYRRREIECLAWLAENEKRFPVHRRPPPWLALDDIAYWFTIPCWNLHVVDYRTGLTDADVKAVVRRLQTMLRGPAK